MSGRSSTTVRSHQVRAQHQALVDGLIALNPKKRRTGTISWIVITGCIYFFGALGSDASVRESLFSPHADGRAPQFSAEAPHQPKPAPTVVTMPAFAVPALAPQQVAVADPVESPLPHAKAHHTAPTKRAHSRGRHSK